MTTPEPVPTLPWPAEGGGFLLGRCNVCGQFIHQSWCDVKRADREQREYEAASREMRRQDEVTIANLTGTAHRIQDGPNPGQVVISETCLHKLMRLAERAR